MTRHNNREEILATKAAEVETMLNAWAKGADVLDAGEKLVFSLRIEKVPVVERDAGDFIEVPQSEHPMLALPITGREMPGHGGRVKAIRPARLTDVQVKEMLKLFDFSKLGLMRHFLVDRHNNPTAHGSASLHQAKINVTLRTQKVVPDKKLSLASDRSMYQLWEVESV